MVLQFCKYLSYSLVLVLVLSLLCNHTKITSKNSYLNEGWNFTGRFKIGSVRGMINKEVMAQFIYKRT